MIPINYISNSTDRFSFYTKINNAKKETDFKDIEIELGDRYGKIPKETESFINLAKLSFLYNGSLVNNITIGEDSLVFSLPRKIEFGGDQFIPRILSYENKNIIKKKFKEELKSVSVVFLIKKGYSWYDELINCNSLFYKT